MSNHPGAPAPVSGLCLALDATNRWMTVGLHGRGIALERSVEAPRESFQQLVATVRVLLDEAGVRRPDWLATVVGPGSFTGTRVSVGAARNFAQLWNVPVRAVESLRFYLYDLAGRLDSGPGDEVLVVLIDGKQQRVYGASASRAEIGTWHSASGIPDSVSDSGNRLPGPRFELYDIDAGEFLTRFPASARVFGDDVPAIRAYLPEKDRERVAALAAPSAARLVALAASRPALSWSELHAVYMRADPAHAKFPTGFTHT